jgi:flavin reductase (DIM6/NTAB) family NADH-FMN oxidoreductase RutF
MPKRPWNRTNLPVYSVSSRNVDGKHNMHIITYATAISMQPKRFACGIYEGTQTLENINSHPQFVLQLLAASQYRLVDLLGKQSGKNIDKVARLQKRQLTTQWNGFTILKDCLAVMQLKVINRMNAGDHTLMLCDVVSYKNLQEGEPLTLDILRQHKLIRI